MNSLRELYVKELKDLYDAEDQIIKALPKLIDGASSEELQDALNEHLEITRQQAERIEQIFRNMGEKLEKCQGMDGLIKEGNDIISEDMDENVKDAGFISAAQKVEHYEMAGYGTVRTWANLLGQDEAEELLRQTLDRKKKPTRSSVTWRRKSTSKAEVGEEEEADERAASQQRKPKKSGSRSRRVA